MKLQTFHFFTIEKRGSPSFLFYFFLFSLWLWSGLVVLGFITDSYNRNDVLSIVCSNHVIEALGR